MPAESGSEFDWKLMTKRLQVVLERRLTEGLQKESEKCQDYAEKCERLAYRISAKKEEESCILER